MSELIFSIIHDRYAYSPYIFTWTGTQIYKHGETSQWAPLQKQTLVCISLLYWQSAPLETPQHWQHFEKNMVTFATALQEPSNEMVPLFTVLQKKSIYTSVHLAPDITERYLTEYAFKHLLMQCVTTCSQVNRFLYWKCDCVPCEEVLTTSLNVSICDIESRRLEQPHTVQGRNKEDPWEILIKMFYKMLFRCTTKKNKYSRFKKSKSSYLQCKHWREIHKSRWS